MAGTQLSCFSERDILFLLETVNPKLLSKIDTIKGDPDIIEGMIDHESRHLFERIISINEGKVTATISPRFLFEVLLRTARGDLESQTYTVERIATQKIPVFDTKEVVHFLNNRIIIRYLADMLSSFTRIESFTVRMRIRKGIWRKIRFNDMDIDSLLRFCHGVDEEQRFGLYKRIADLCLFILGMFPEYATMDYRYPSNCEVRPRLFGRLRRSMEDYEKEGRRFYKLAGENKYAAILDVAEVLRQLYSEFNLAKKPLNYISSQLLQFKKERLFPAISSD